MRKRLQKGIAAFVVTALFIGGGIALAAWTTSSAANHASGKYGSLSAVVTVTPTTGAADLFPGSNGSLYVKFSNPNPQAVNASSIDGALASFTGCTTPGASLRAFDSGSLYTNAGAGWTVPGNGTLSVTLSNAVAISNASSTDCQNATLDVGGLVINTTT